jgi:serine/threonine protein kinase/tetratricopeptide (TPR) repeat protein
MDSTRWERIQELFHQALDRPEAERHIFLKSACGDDGTLLTDVLALLEEDGRGVSVLDQGMAQIANQLLDEGGLVPPSLREFGPYRVIRVLGEGGMGIVYLAERKDLSNLVAIKVLRDSWLSPARRGRFASEQRTLAQLNHPSIARLYDADTLPDGTPWFVMEYVEGIPLTDYCAQYQCSIEQRLHLFRAVCEAVQYAHGHAFIHRDLKPSNILVKGDGSVRLLDFGIAKQLEGFEGPVTQTMTGLRLMTPAYAAPEQIRGERIGIHTDVYSLGVILFELLTGQLPFDLSNLTPAEAATIITSHEPGKPSSVSQTNRARLRTPSAGKNAWSDLDVLCLTAMHKDEQRRYRSVEALIRDVDHYLKGEPLDAQPDSLTYRLGKFVRRNQRSVSLSAAVLVLVIAMAVFFTVHLAKARNAALDEADRTQRIQNFMMNLFEGGDEAVGPSDSLRVVTLLDRGVQEAQTLNHDAKAQSELYQNLGDIYQKLGKLDRADTLLRSALEERRSLFGTDSPEYAESLVALGLLRDAQGRFDEAERLTREGLDIDRRKLSPSHPRVAKATAALGKVLEDRGSYDQSIQVLQEAVRLQSSPGGPTADLAETMTELANSHFYSGHYQVSESLNQQVLTMDRQLYGERHPHVADDLINLGAIQYDLGRYPEAELFDRQALDITQSFYGKSHPATASALTILGRTLVTEGKSDEASGMLREALAIEEQVYGKVHPRVAGTLNELGKIAQQQGKLDEAAADFTRMADIYKSVYAGKHYYIGIALSNLAGVYVDRQDYKGAERLFREALQIYAATLSADHLNVGIARVRLGRALVFERRFSDAEAETLAGYEILMKQPGAPERWLLTARTDLVTIYDALKQPDKSAKFRAELAHTSEKLPKIASKK